MVDLLGDVQVDLAVHDIPLFPVDSALAPPLLGMMTPQHPPLLVPAQSTPMEPLQITVLPWLLLPVETPSGSSSCLLPLEGFFEC